MRLKLFLPILLLFLVVPVLAEQCTTPADDLIITQNTVLCAGKYTLSDTNSDGIIKIESNAINLDCNNAEFTGDGSGIAISAKGNDIDIKNCIISKYKIGINAEQFQGTIESNQISKSKTAINIYSAMLSSIRANKIESNEEGIIIQSSKKITLLSDEFKNNKNGISFIDSEGCEISVNDFNCHSSFALSFKNSKDNLIYKNRFVKCGTENFVSSDAASINLWTDATGNGNFWSDYSGVDANSDGIGDTPHIIDENNKDTAPQVSSVSADIKKFFSFLEGVIKEFELSSGDLLTIDCQGEPTKVQLVALSPPAIKINGITFEFKDNYIYFDLNADRLNDLSFRLLDYNENAGYLKIKAARLSTCTQYCGDSRCSGTENQKNCPSDCKPADTDVDGVIDEQDNCKSVPNKDQQDNDEDAVGDLCDNCPKKYNPDQFDEDGDLKGDACEGVSPQTILIIVLIFITLTGFIIAMPGPRRIIRKLPEDFKSMPKVNREEELKKRSEIAKLKEYARQYVKEGYTYQQIVDTLTAEGWKPAQVDYVLKEVIYEEKRDEEQTGSVKAGSALDKLRKAAKKDIESGMSLEEVKNKLQEDGWSNTIIKLILKDFNK